MSAATDLDVLKDIPEYKTILKGVIKTQIQLLVEQLAQHTEEESIILTASVSDGTLSHLGTSAGKQFLDGHDEIKSQFLGFCLSTRHTTSQHSASLSDSKVNDLPSPVKKRTLRSTPSAAKRPRIVQSTVARVTASGDGSDISPSVDRRTSTSEKKRKFVGRKPGPASSRRPIACTSTSDNDDIDSKVKLETASDNQDDEQFDVTEQNTSTPVNLPPSIHLPHTQTAAGDDSDTQDNDNDEVDDVDDFPPGDDDVSDSGSVSNIKVEPITEGEFGSEMTGAERSENAEQPAGSDWGPDTSTAEGDDSVDQSPNKSAYISAQNDESNLHDDSVLEDTCMTANGTTMYPCKMCNNVYKRKEALRRHSRVHNPSTRPSRKEDAGATCEVCGKTFTHLSCLNGHKRCHQQREYSCIICAKEFVTNWMLTRHLESHQGDKNLCPTCGKSFTRRDIMQRHIDTTHLQVGGQTCDICGKVYHNRAQLHGHKIAKHGEEKTLKCTKCNKRFSYMKNLKYHTNNVCGNRNNGRGKEKVVEPQPKKCDDCGKYFLTNKSLVQHRHIHEAPSLICSACGRSFKWKSSLTAHSLRCNH